MVSLYFGVSGYTDQIRQANKVIKDLKDYKCYLTGIIISPDKNISAKMFDKLSKYKYLEIEMTIM